MGFATILYSLGFMIALCVGVVNVKEHVSDNTSISLKEQATLISTTVVMTVFWPFWFLAECWFQMNKHLGQKSN